MMKFSRVVHAAFLSVLFPLVAKPCYSLVAPWSGGGAATSRNIIPKDCNVLILPGFGNDSSDYTMPGSLVSSLQKRGWAPDQIRVLKVERRDWLQVFLRGAFDLQFWLANAAPTRPAFEWYLSRVVEEIKQSQEANRNVLLVGHSAGGWLARAAVGYGSNASNSELQEDDESSTAPVNLDKVLGIVTLGAPNLPPPPGVMDMTRGALRITNEDFPGAFHAPSTFYVTVIGEAVKGKKQQRSSPLEPTTVDGFAFQSYQAVCGDGNTIGDGVVPMCAAHIDDSIQLDLRGVFHSINKPDQWYGSDSILDQWHDCVLGELEKKKGTSAGVPNLLEWFQPSRQQ